MRCGLIARKIGMTRVFDENSKAIALTLLKVENCKVVSVKNVEKNGYNAVCLSAGIQKASRLNKPQKVYYEKNKLEAPRKTFEFRVSEDCAIPMGSELSVSHFIKGQPVDATAITQGKGFAGSMKRHNFGGLCASHGVGVQHRTQGSTGQQGMSKVFKGKKMSGQMGSTQITTQNLIVYGVDEEQGLVMIQGAVPGCKNAWVRLKDAVKIDTPKDVPMPAGLKLDSKEIKVEVQEEVQQ